MAGYVPNEFRAQLLDAISGRAALGATTVYLGLASAVPENPLTSTLANISEVTTAGYARKAIPAFSAATTVAPVQTTTPTAFSFDTFTEDMASPAFYAFVTAAASGTGAPIRFIFELPGPLSALAGQPINIPASSLIIQ